MSTNYVIDHIPKTTPYNRRPAFPLAPKSITIHNTGNPTSTARNERAYLTNPSNTRTASYHIVIDEREAIECIPLNENAWAAGDGSGLTSGNRTSIHIEICESGNYAKTLDIAAALAAKLLKQYGLGLGDLKRHFDWSGKICPRLMYDGGKWTGWAMFKAMVAAELNPPKPVTVASPDEVTLIVKGKTIKGARLIDGVTYAPLRDTAEALGASVSWDAKTKTATVV